MANPTVLVTGGAGYIGSVTSAALLQRGYDVVIVDDLRRGHRDLVPAGARLVEADVGEPEQFADVLASVDACLHFAAAIEAGESMVRPEAFFAANTAATLRLLHALVDAGVGRFVFSSTAAVYGDPVRVPITEDDPLDPTNAYGESKLLVERALAWLTRLRGLRTASLRYFNASGATPERGEDHSPETHLIPIVLQVAAGRRESVSIFGTDYETRDGTCVRDYIHVTDLAEAHVAALTALDDHERLVCNLGNGTGFTVREVIDSARRITGHPIPAVEAPRRPGDPATLVASSERARTLLGWKPQHPELDDIVASAWEWHQRRWGV
ncbi:MAG TPA: UDP-glucose 4-epimerase GalE [Egibacteraceae bacterium]|nr:UDP-glucose 4-epimerase GalE [Egibacteraceae bacterium]